jgi:hypothetical protein
MTEKEVLRKDFPRAEATTGTEPRRRAAAVPVALTGRGRSEPETDSAEPL